MPPPSFTPGRPTAGTEFRETASTGTAFSFVALTEIKAHYTHVGNDSLRRAADSPSYLLENVIQTGAAPHRSQAWFIHQVLFERLFQTLGLKAAIHLAASLGGLSLSILRFQAAINRTLDVFTSSAEYFAHLSGTDTTIACWRVPPIQRIFADNSA